MKCQVKRCPHTVTYSEKRGGYCDDHAATVQRCSAQVYPGDAIFGSHQCMNVGKVEEGRKWWCGVHSNATKDKRRAKREERYDKWWAGIETARERDEETKRRAGHFVPLVEALGRLIAVTETVPAGSRAYAKAVAVLNAAKEE